MSIILFLKEGLKQVYVCEMSVEGWAGTLLLCALAIMLFYFLSV